MKQKGFDPYFLSNEIRRAQPMSQPLTFTPVVEPDGLTPVTSKLQLTAEVQRLDIVKMHGEMSAVLAAITADGKTLHLYIAHMATQSM